MLLCLANIGDVLADVFKYVYSNVCCCGCCRRKKQRKNNRQSPRERESPEAWKSNYNKGRDGGGPVIIEDDDDDEDEEEEEQISVPLTITMAVIAVYILIGAAMFTVWEDDWDILISSYFSFVTVSTIGFGDYVPGSSSLASSSDQLQMVAASIYMLFGLALVSMCFSLIQEEIAAKFKWVGEKLGLVEKDEDDDDDDEESDDEDEKERR